MKISQLKKLIKNKCHENEWFSLSNIWKKDKKNILCIGVYTSDLATFSSYYQGHIEMDFQGKVLGVFEGRGQKEYTKMSSLVGKQIDLNSFEKDYDKIIKNKAVGVESCEYLGFIDEKGVHIINNTNIDKFPLAETYEGNQEQIETHGNWHLVGEWKNFIKKYRKQIKSSNIHNDCSTNLHTIFKINGFTVDVKLSCFFRYQCKIRIFSNKERTDNYMKGSVIELIDSEITQFDAVMEELKNNKLSAITKAKILSYFSGVKYVSFTTDKDEVVADIRFDGYRGRPNGKYKFNFDFKKKVITCASSQSKAFIPKTLVELNKEIKIMEKNGYFFV
jgi:hypothetical protein